MLKPERLLLEARRSSRPLVMLVVSAGLAAVTFAGIARNLTFERPWRSYRTVRAQFDDVKGIFPGGHQVRIHGVKVGIVSSSSSVDGHPVLTLKIEKKWGPVYKDARLRIRPVTPLEDLYVNITDRGHPSAGEATTKDIIAADQTVSPVDVSRVLDTFDADTRQRMSMLLSELGRGLDDGGVKLRATFASLAPFLHVAQDTTRVLAERQRAMKRVIHNFGRLSAALAQRDAALDEFVTQGTSALGQLAANDQPLAATLQGLGQLVPVMRDSFATLEGMSGRLDPALTALQPVAGHLQSGLGGLQKLGTDATPALAVLRPATRDLRTMAGTLPATSFSLSNAFTRLRKQAPQLDSLTSQLVPCMDTLNRFLNNTMSVMKYTDANGALPRSDEIVDADVLPDIGSPPLNLRPIGECAAVRGRPAP